jgi:hypothetical protein
MKTIISLMISLVMAMALCLVLLVSGGVKIKDYRDADQLKRVSEKIMSKIGMPSDGSPAVEEEKSSLGAEIESSPVSAERSSSSSPANGSSENLSTTVAEGDAIHGRVLEFLSTEAGTDTVGIEDRFDQFLKQELGLSQKESDEMLRMCFWMDFVTLQQDWQRAKLDDLQQAFIREKELKQAGFMAKGLTLMASEIREGEARLEELGQQLSPAALEGERS